MWITAYILIMNIKIKKHQMHQCFLVNAVNSHWKYPVVYYLTNKFTGAEKSIVGNHILTMIHKTGCEVITFTFDDASSNFIMAK